jgi:hypothetical protein
MAKLTQYRQIIQKILTEYRDWAAGSNQIGVQECVAFDEGRDHSHHRQSLLLTRAGFCEHRILAKALLGVTAMFTINRSG